MLVMHFHSGTVTMVIMEGEEVLSRHSLTMVNLISHGGVKFFCLNDYKRVLYYLAVISMATPAGQTKGGKGMDTTYEQF
jgi:hypothetical protein